MSSILELLDSLDRNGAPLTGARNEVITEHHARNSDVVAGIEAQYPVRLRCLPNLSVVQSQSVQSLTQWRGAQHRCSQLLRQDRLLAAFQIAGVAERLFR